MRLLTRSDFDGLACAAILKAIGVIDHWKFVHPKDIQDGIVEVTDNDVLANIPYVPGCNMWFDHHSSENTRIGEDIEFIGESRIADSAARVIYDYYGGAEKLPNLEELVKACDKVDSGKLTREDILNPEGWVLLGFMMDPRTGLGRFREFRIPNYMLMEHLIDACKSQKIDEILANPDVAERVKLYFEQEALFKEMLRKYTRVDGNVIVTDLRGVHPIYTGNRFLIYSLFPDQNISLWIVDGREKLNVSIACGYSILDRSCKTDVGELMLQYGGGGHKQVGTCQVPYAEADKAIAEIAEKIKADENA
ncbi:MAG: exopolyphosphatase [Defluviitaleaceae bacterium]|nr:exopolyphosphatase [Defluviitaleaceae bacterium]MCL2836425.1 exopolyphosphatase [Defluviitaleaceae bacterium]